MRKRQSFLLTILTPENGSASFCGQIKVISSGKTYTFTSLDDLRRLIATQMDEETAESFAHLDLNNNFGETTIGTPGL